MKRSLTMRELPFPSTMKNLSYVQPSDDNAITMETPSTDSSLPPSLHHLNNHPYMCPRQKELHLTARSTPLLALLDSILQVNATQSCQKQKQNQRKKITSAEATPLPNTL